MPAQVPAPLPGEAVDPTGLAHMARQLLLFGTATAVAEPPGLKQMVTDLAIQWVGHHSDHTN